MTIDDLEGWIGKTSEEISAPAVECPAPKQWSMWDGMGTEVEVLQFLYALVCMLKPVRIIETSTYLGYGTAHLALGAKHNGFGYLNSAEPIKDLTDKAMQRITSLGLDDYVAVWLGTGVQLIGAQEVVDFAFLDDDTYGEGVYINNVLILESQDAITAQDLASKLGFDVNVMESDEAEQLPFHLDKVKTKEYIA